MCPGILVCSHVKTPPLPGKGCGCGCCCGCQLSHQPEPRSYFSTHSRDPQDPCFCALKACTDSVVSACSLILYLCVGKTGMQLHVCCCLHCLMRLLSRHPSLKMTLKSIEWRKHGTRSQCTNCTFPKPGLYCRATSPHRMKSSHLSRNVVLMLWVEKVKTGDICGGV